MYQVSVPTSSFYLIKQTITWIINRAVVTISFLIYGDTISEITTTAPMRTKINFFGLVADVTVMTPSAKYRLWQQVIRVCCPGCQKKADALRFVPPDMRPQFPILVEGLAMVDAEDGAGVLMLRSRHTC